MPTDAREARRRILSLAALSVAMVLLATVACEAREHKPPSEADLQKVSEALPERATAKPVKARKVLIFDRCEGFYHGCIPLASEALLMLGEKTGAYSAVISQDYAMFNPDKLDGFDAVILNNTTKLKLDETQRAALLEFVKGGKGIIGIHAATDNFYDWEEGAEMMGGCFAGHPWGGGGTWAIEISEPEHVLNKAFEAKGFLIKDELYKFRDPYSRENLRILVGIDMDNPRNKEGREDKDNAISWIRELGDGRVFYCSFGHNNHIFWTPAVLQHYLDGIQFAFGDLKADATPSAKLANKPTPAKCME